ALAARLKQDGSYDAHFQMRAAVEPPQPETVIKRFHYALAIGDRAQAQRLLDDAGKDGVVLPQLLGRQLKS
ncbi:MAG TPA: hypothetical protein VJ608_11345, partial [Albitalea sp.]|nr:hypothetical protein [Albitalea sp.]